MRAQCIHFPHLIRMSRLTAKVPGTVSWDYRHQHRREGAETRDTDWTWDRSFFPSLPPRCCLQSNTCEWKAVVLLCFISDLVLATLNPCPFPFSRASLEKAECCFPPALACFRNPDLVKTSSSHVFIWHSISFLIPVDRAKC